MVWYDLILPLYAVLAYIKLHISDFSGLFDNFCKNSV